MCALEPPPSRYNAGPTQIASSRALLILDLFHLFLWDLYKLIATVPGDEAFRPLDKGGCPLVT